jgi:diphthamide biosynthesis protein 3
MTTFPLAKLIQLDCRVAFEQNIEKRENRRSLDSSHPLLFKYSRSSQYNLAPGQNLETGKKMADDDQISIYDEIEIEDMTFDPNLQIYTYPCPCGDRFEIAIDSLRDGEEIAVCPSCSLMIRVIFDVVSQHPPRWF